MTAVKLAIENTGMLETSSPHMQFAVFTDSLSTAETFIFSRANSRPALRAEILDLLNTVNGNVTLIWLPSHIGIEGNEKADRLANAGTKHPNVDIYVGRDLKEMYEESDVYYQRVHAAVPTVAVPTVTVLTVTFPTVAVPTLSLIHI